MIYKFLKPLIFKMDAECAHNSAISYLKYFPNLATNFVLNKNYENLKQNLFGLNFKTPIGMAAGFDKNAEVVKALHQFGFGFVEAGTVTLKPQIGNDKPRIFRLKEDEAIINRLGFNNKGAENFLKNISKNFQEDLILGINIGKNKDTENALDDYLPLLQKFHKYASYITVNISSPNTKNLRDLHNQDALDLFLSELMKKKVELKNSTPIWLKISPDLENSELEKVASVILKNKIDAVIISNTTVARPSNLKNNFKNEIGGLSGKPLFSKSNEVLRNFYKLTEGKIPLIGVGGISSAKDAYTKIKLGASLVQIYSSFIYQGFGSVGKITDELSELVKKDGFENVSQAVGIENGRGSKF